MGVGRTLGGWKSPNDNNVNVRDGVDIVDVDVVVDVGGAGAPTWI